MKKNYQGFVTGLIGLLVLAVLTLPSWTVFAENLTVDPKEELVLDLPPLDLILPEPLQVEVEDGQFLFAWDAKGYASILKIYTGYTLWADNYINALELEYLFELRIGVCQETLIIKQEVIDLITEDREHAYDLFKEERVDLARLERRNRFKTIFIAGGAGVVGVAGGIILGLFLR